MDLQYILEKIQNSTVLEQPFRHIEINDFFKEADFKEIIQSPEISIKKTQDDRELFKELFRHDYKIIEFPGCTTDYKKYIKQHHSEHKFKHTHTACEGMGVVLRLKSPKTATIKILQDFLNSPELINCMAKKFDIKSDKCNYDAGIQKYLDGYEISPHPDIRKKR